MDAPSNEAYVKPNWEVFPAEMFEFRLAVRRIGDDGGPTLEVYGRHGSEWRPVLKFDAFEKRPHWHRCHPEAKDDILQLPPQPLSAHIDFATAQLRDHLPVLLTEQGFADLAEPARGAAVREAIAHVEDRLRAIATQSTITEL